MILLLTELVLLTSVLSVTWISRHNTITCSGTVASKISSILGHVKQVMLWRLHTHTVGNLQSVLDVTT